ncbi:MAG: molybdopterin-guanine dinucleotide biosynthesis protein B [Gammaproteobacteria bacterium]|nr:molybdopterin-guanine dinucleotide biosynthesis protein B [Gammaproteobacteria bacterium]
MSTINYPKPVLGIAAFSGTGKTQLIVQLIPLLKQCGLRVAVIKHAHHQIDIDKPGKDSYKMRQSGAAAVLLASDKRIALMIEKPEPGATEINELLALIKPELVDLVLVEGYKNLPHDKLFLFRHAIKDRHQQLDDDVCHIMNQASTLAIVSDLDTDSLAACLKTDKTVLDINNINAVKDFILHYCNTTTVNEINND